MRSKTIAATGVLALVLALSWPSAAVAAAPTATVALADTSLAIGDTSGVTITFSEAVAGFANDDVTVQNGTLSTVSSFDGVTWTAIFTPSTGITDTANILTLNLAGVTDLSTTAGSGTVDSNNYAIDTQRPTASVVVSDTALAAGETSLVTIIFSEAVTGLTNANVAAESGILSAVSSSDLGITWTATFTPNTNISDTSNVITVDLTGAADLAGNAGSGTATSNNYTIDTLRPTATVVVADNALTVGESSLVTITFSEAVSGFSNADATVAGGTLSSVTSSDGGLTWTATFTPTANHSQSVNAITIDLTGVSDTSGNVGSGTVTSNNYAIDTRRPTATVVLSDTALSIGETSTVTLTFSEAVTGFTLADMTVENGTLSALATWDNVTYTATFTPTAGITDTANVITMNLAGVVDIFGNAGSGTVSSNNYAIDHQRPTGTVVLADVTLMAGEVTEVTFTFSEAVSGFTVADLALANGTLSALSSDDGGVTWTAIFTPVDGVSDLTNLITVTMTGLTDLAGNAGSGTSSSANYSVDTLRPTASVVVADSALTVGESSLVTITFSEAVAGFSNADATVAGGTLSSVTSSDGGVTWTATFTPTAGLSQTSNAITIDLTGVSNASGNAGSGTAASNSYGIDTQRPTATIVVSDGVLNPGETSVVTITFSEAVVSFALPDLTVPNGVLSTLASVDGGMTWTATYTPTAGLSVGVNVIEVNLAGVVDAAGNPGTGAAVSNIFAVRTAAAPAPEATASATASLPATGADTSGLLLLAGLLLGTGLATSVISRRGFRRSHSR